MSAGSVSDSLANPPPKSCSNRVANAVSSARNVVWKRSPIIVSSSAISSRVLAMAVVRSAAWASIVSRRDSHGGVFVDGERVDRAELVEPSTQLPEPDGAGWRPGWGLPRPDRGNLRQCRFERGDLVRDADVLGTGPVRVDRVRVDRRRVDRIHVGRCPGVRTPLDRGAGYRMQVPDGQVAEPGQLDDHTLA